MYNVMLLKLGYHVMWVKNRIINIASTNFKDSNDLYMSVCSLIPLLLDYR